MDPEQRIRELQQTIHGTARWRGATLEYILGHLEPGDVVLNAKQVAILLGVHPSTVSKRERKGQLPEAIKTEGGHRRWLRSDILAYAWKGACDVDASVAS